MAKIRHALSYVSEGSKEYQLAFDKWSKLSLRRAKSANSSESAKEAHLNAPFPSEARSIAFQKRLYYGVVSSDPKMLAELYNELPEQSLEQVAALEKLLEIL